MTEGPPRWLLPAALAVVPSLLIGLVAWVVAAQPGPPVTGAVVVTSPGPTAPASVSPSLAPPLQPTRAPAATCTRTAPVRVMTFNIHHGAKGADLDLRQLVLEIRAVSPDVVALQEVDRDNARSAYVDEAAWLARRLDLTPLFGATLSRGQSEYGNALLTRLPVLGQADLRLPNLRGLEPRGLLLAALDVHGITLVVGATHFQHRPPEPRVLQAEYVVQALQAENGPRVLMGDLNDEPGSRPLAILGGGLLHDVWTDVGEGPGWTHPAFHAARRIDFVLGDEGVRAAQAGVLRSRVSDHRAVWADLSITGPVDC